MQSTYGSECIDFNNQKEILNLKLASRWLINHSIYLKNDFKKLRRQYHSEYFFEAAEIQTDDVIISTAFIFHFLNYENPIAFCNRFDQLNEEFNQLEITVNKLAFFPKSYFFTENIYYSLCRSVFYN